MNTFDIPQSPNWYKSNAIALDQRGTLMAYGSRTIVVLVKGLESNSAYDLQYNRLGSFTKKHRIIAVSFSHKTDNYEDAHFLASIDNFNIYIWKVKSLAFKCLHSFPKQVTNQIVTKINLVDIVWLYKCLKLVVTTDCGTLYEWNIQTSEMIKYTLDSKIQPLTLSACPHKNNIIAIGCKDGILIVYDLTDSGQILHEIHCHIKNIVSLTWCPVPYNPLSSDQSTEPLLLASTASDRTGLSIWRAGLDMSSEVTVLLPKKPLRDNIFKSNTRLIWSCIKWVKPTLIIITSNFGEIIKVEFRPEQNFKPIITLISDSHKDIIFSIACSSESNKPYLWSTCMSGKLIRTPLFDTTNTGDLPFNVPTINGYVHCFSLSPANVSNFAFGVGDGKMYCLNLSNTQQFEITALNSFSSKVLSLAYHPKNENLLAFGTDDGRIGMFNLKNKQNNIKLLKTVVSLPVNCLCWAPLPNKKFDEDVELILYAVCGGEIIIYNDTNIWNDPRNLKEYTQFNEIKDKHVKHIHMAWQPNYNVVAVGNANGTIYLLERDTFKLKHVVNTHFQPVECITWHPTHVTCDNSKESKFKNCFASSSNSIQVHQLNDDGKPLLVVKFEGHTEKVNDLAWSPHRNLWLLSCSNDMTAKIWDVEKSTLVGIYSKHLSAVLCGIFSPFDNDIVFTGSSDSSIHSWRVKPLHNKLKDSTKNKNRPLAVINEQVIGSFNSEKINPNKIKEFPYSSNLFDGNYLKEAVHQFIDYHYNDNKISVTYTPENLINYLALSYTSEEMNQLLTKDYNVLLNTQSLCDEIIPHINNMSMWSQNIEDYLKNAIANHTINDWMVAVSPSISHEFWANICDAYARQLEIDGQLIKASTYLVGLKKYKEAAMMLVSYNLFREALFITFSQEIPNKEIILEITKQWAQYNCLHGKFKEATIQYLGIKDATNAIRCLMKINQIEELTLAAKLARHLNEEMELSLVVNILNMEYFKHCKWNEAREFLDNHPRLVYLNMLVSVHKTIFEFDPDITPKKIKNWICATDNEDKSTIFDYILENVDCNQDYYDKIMNLVDTDFTSDASLLLQKITVFIAGQLCLIALQYQKFKFLTNDSQKQLIKCFAVAINYDIYKFSWLMMWIFPKGPLVLNSFTIFELNDTLLKTIKAYVCFICFLWFKPLYSDLNNQIEGNKDKKNENTICSEIVILTHQFQQLFYNYKHDILDLETLYYFIAKEEIKHVDELLALHFSVGNRVRFSECITQSPNSIEEIKYVVASEQEKTIPVNNEIVESLAYNLNKFNIVGNDTYKKSALNNQESDYSSESYQDENMDMCDLVNTNGSSMETQDHAINFINPEKNSAFSMINNVVNIKNETFKRVVCGFYQNLLPEFDKYNYLFKKELIIQHDISLNKLTLKKKNLDNLIAEFENQRINSPDPFLFIMMLKNYFHTIN